MFKKNPIKSVCVKKNNCKPIKSGMSYEQALNEFTSTGKPWGDYWEMQQDWTFFVDSLVRDDLVDYEEARWWDNPCTPQTFREWIESSKKSVKSSRRFIKSEVSDDMVKQAQELCDAEGKYATKKVVKNGVNYYLCATPLAIEDFVENKILECFGELADLFRVPYDDKNVYDYTSEVRDNLIENFESLTNGKVIYGYVEY